MQYTNEYREYLFSPKWHRIRQRKFKQVGRKCELCGALDKIEVHHLTYQRLFRERLGDLQVLCKSCHPLADESRRRAKAIDTYMRKVAGDNWRSQITDSEAATQFDGWLKGKNGN